MANGMWLAPIEHSPPVARIGSCKIQPTNGGSDSHITISPASAGMQARILTRCGPLLFHDRDLRDCAHDARADSLAQIERRSKRTAHNTHYGKSGITPDQRLEKSPEPMRGRSIVRSTPRVTNAESLRCSTPAFPQASNRLESRPDQTLSAGLNGKSVRDISTGHAQFWQKEPGW